VGLPTDIDGLVARGLDRYRAGDIDGALAAWETALATHPDDPRALGYVDYVRQNYDELSGASNGPMSELLIPFGLARGDDDDYEVSITLGEDLDDTTGDITGTHTPTRSDVLPPVAPEPSIDDGWGLEAENEPTWFAGSARRALDLAAVAALETAQAPSGWIELEADEPSGDRLPSEGGFGDDDRTRDFQQLHAPPLPPEFPLDFGNDNSGEATVELGAAGTSSDFGPELTGERTIERGAIKLAPEVLRSLGIAPIGEGRAASEDQTVERWSRVPEPEPSESREGTLDLGPAVTAPVVEPLPPPERFEDEGTADLKGKVRLLDVGGAPARRDDDRRSIPVEDLLLPPPPGSTKIVDDDSREEKQPRSRALTADEEVTARISEEVDRGAPLHESHEDRARRRIAMLLERAQAAAAGHDHASAVAAIDLALSEAPDVAAAQKLVHRSRDLILDCYYRFFGNLDRMPVLAAPLAELTKRPLDPRAAFLLSRIDGTLTYEEILDVAGMGRLEACRHLAHLLWRGIIRVP